MYQIINGSTPIAVLLLVDSADDESSKTGVTGITCQISKNGGAFTNVTNAITEIGLGFYKVTLSSTETNTDGPLLLVAEKSGVSNVYRFIYQVYTPVSTINATITGIAQSPLELMADGFWRRTYANIRARAAGSGVDAVNKRSPLGMMAKFVNKITQVDTVLTTYHEDDTTSFYTQTATLNAGATPVTALDTD